MRFQTLDDTSPKSQARQAQPMARPEGVLSKREQEVLRLVAKGQSNREIAHNLIISQNTVKIHLHHIFEKLQVQSRTEAAMLAVQQGWVSVTQATKPVTLPTR